MTPSSAPTDPLTATRLTLIRHGETSWNLSGHIQGHADVALNARGLAQAQRLGAALAGNDIDAIYSSDLARAHQTAQALQAHATRALPLTLEPGLRERCFGVLQGLTLQDICAKDPQLAEAFQTRDPDYCPPEGESMHQFRARVLATTTALARRHAGQHLALVAHGGVLDILYRHATGLDLQTPRSWAIDNTSVHRLLWSTQGLTLLSWGDVAHLDVFDEPDKQDEDSLAAHAAASGTGQHYL